MEKMPRREKGKEMVEVQLCVCEQVCECVNLVYFYRIEERISCTWFWLDSSLAFYCYH